MIVPETNRHRLLYPKRRVRRCLSLREIAETVVDILRGEVIGIGERSTLPMCMPLENITSLTRGGVDQCIQFERSPEAVVGEEPPVAVSAMRSKASRPFGAAPPRPASRSRPLAAVVDSVVEHLPGQIGLDASGSCAEQVIVMLDTTLRVGLRISFPSALYA